MSQKNRDFESPLSPSLVAELILTLNNRLRPCKQKSQLGVQKIDLDVHWIHKVQYF